MKTMFLFAVFLSFLMAKLILLKNEFSTGITGNDFLSVFLIKILEILTFFEVEKLEITEYISLDHPYENVAIIINSMITYFPTSLMISFIAYIILKIFKR